MRLITLTLCAAALVALSLPASADVALTDWCVNLNGDINTACNGAGSGSAAIDLSGFDQTTDPNKLGKIVVNVGTGTSNAAVYMDYDVDFNDTTPPCPHLGCGSDTDIGSTSGSPSATQSYELGDPNASNIFSDFQGFTQTTPLPDSNSVNAAACNPNFPPQYCDVSWALAESIFVDPALYSGAKITFTASATAPTSGFYLQQTNGITGDTIYLSDTVSLTPIGGNGGSTPEPMSVVLFGTLVLGALFLRRRSAVNAA